MDFYICKSNIKMDIIYYSNYCKHSQKLLQYLVKHGFNQSLNCVCIDQRTKDPNTGQTYLIVDRGTKVLFPPNIESVPALLLITDKYRVLLGEDIYRHFQPIVANQNNLATGNNGEPTGFMLSNMTSSGLNVVSEQYTYYNMTPDELSSKGRGGRRQMHNYVPATLDTYQIPTPEETYKADKIGEVSMDSLQQKRNQEVLDAKTPISVSLDSAMSNTNVYTPKGPPQGPPSVQFSGPNVQTYNIGLQPPPYASQQTSVYGQGTGFSNHRNPQNSFFVNI
jgi:hypothetical protein